MLFREVDELLSALWLDVRSVDHGQATGRQTLARDEVQDVEGVLAGRLIVFVVGDQAAAKVARYHFGRCEVLLGERRLARPAGADEHHEA